MANRIGGKIDDRAVIYDGAVLEGECQVEANVHIYPDVEICRGTVISQGTIIYGPARIDVNTHLGPHCIVGHPQRGDALVYPFRKRGRMGVEVGKDCIIRSGSVIYNEVELGDRVETGHNTLIREKTEIGVASLIGTNTVIDGCCKIGAYCRLQTGVYLAANIKIEDRVFLGPNCVLLNDKYMMQRETCLRGPTIKSGASIGGNTTIIPEVSIGEGAVIGAGSVVLSDVEPRTIYVGVPAKRLKAVPKDWKIRLGEGRG